VEKTKVSADVILVSMDVTSLYTNIPQGERINTVCQAHHEIFRIISPPFQSGTSEKRLVFFLRKSLSIQWKRLLTNGTAMGTKMALAFANVFTANIEKEILRQST